ncbi:N-acetylmannosamine-6-phosphate 2-epimerase [Alkalibacillus haloalkaliphilus]|uniref:Putative N-acetylmannosamine-6-phosphate 2-epimerase n=1 Tax=Alkalibacillus haloalkaliphilus TaxID=94136 RepID=A0A511W6B1_9BACI|nr:N-acetylmannosamine-6-phosphate 2-epimerase [Alkalibacillus haloalkaliphilus]GEN46639.1 putative N-acetylmannosamine-6-phosphate 2-epimerase [Alkalibacillus haloalkaliphilus]
MLEKIKNQLIVSCQALEDEPLHDSYIMGKMALAAQMGGAAGIRANTVSDIQSIKREVDLPIIGIIKRNCTNSSVFITPTLDEVKSLYEEGVDVIALDATKHSRPNGQSFKTFFHDVKCQFPDQLFMADVSTFEEGANAEEAGVDVIATTLVGYTPYSKGVKPLQLVEELVGRLSTPIIAEGNIDTPEKAKDALQLGAHAVVVGSAITRPQVITEKFSARMNQLQDEQIDSKKGGAL